jgi:hypothetical protein
VKFNLGSRQVVLRKCMAQQAEADQNS